MSPSKAMRENSLFMRNNFPSSGKWNYALFKKQNFSIIDFEYCFKKTIDLLYLKANKVYHYFDKIKEKVNLYNLSKRDYKKLEEYSLILSPSSNIYDLPRWKQIVLVGKSRWCASKLQELGLNVIISVFWGDKNTYDFAFDGIEKGSIICIDSRKIENQKEYIQGFNEMKEHICPSQILCFGPKISELGDEIIYLDYTKEEK